MTDAEKIAKLELQLSETARIIPPLLLYATEYPNDTHVKEAIAALKDLARDARTQDQRFYYQRLLNSEVIVDIVRAQR